MDFTHRQSTTHCFSRRKTQRTLMHPGRPTMRPTASKTTRQQPLCRCCARMHSATRRYRNQSRNFLHPKEDTRAKTVSLGTILDDSERLAYAITTSAQYFTYLDMAALHARPWLCSRNGSVGLAGEIATTELLHLKDVRRSQTDFTHKTTCFRESQHTA